MIDPEATDDARIKKSCDNLVATAVTLAVIFAGLKSSCLT
ncbi:hypothetical protein MP213Fo_12240 [Pseudochrobactrum sp. MP213Fo]